MTLFCSPIWLFSWFYFYFFQTTRKVYVYARRYEISRIKHLRIIYVFCYVIHTHSLFFCVVKPKDNVAEDLKVYVYTFSKNIPHLH